MEMPELTVNGTHQRVLVNPAFIVTVTEGMPGKTVMIRLSNGGVNVELNVKESFDEVKKRVGMSIIPRAETLAI